MAGYEPLGPDQVRWYSYRAELTVNGLLTEPEIVHRGSVLRFNDLDTLALENAYRSNARDLERAWWEEQALLQKGDDIASLCLQRDWKDYLEEELSSLPAVNAAPVLVRGGLFEVDLERRTLNACYWPGPQHRVLRGTWFAEKAPDDWAPLQETLADQLEEAYRKCAGRDQPVWDGSAWVSAVRRREEPLQVTLNTRVESGLYAQLFSSREMYLCRSGTLAWLSKKLGSEGRLRLRRGYLPPRAKPLLDKEADARQEAADMVASTTPVRDLVLCVHGIGQTLSTSSIATDTTTFRAIVRAVEADVDEAGQRQAGRTEVLPVQWRRIVDLEVDAVAQRLVPPGIAGLRQVLHATVVEVLLFLTPRHRERMVDAVVRSLNAQYSRFVARNPGFQGSVSVMAHSLGSVLCYEILCNQGPAPALQDLLSGEAPAPPAKAPLDMSLEELRDEVQRLRSAQSPGQAPMRIASIRFTPNLLLLLGSPLSVFLAMRGVVAEAGQGLGSPASGRLLRSAPDQPCTGTGLPLARRLINLYHPYDPVGHRLEPLAYGIADAPPKAQYAALSGGSKRLHIGIQELGEDVSSAASRWGASLKWTLSFGQRGGEGPEAAAAEAVARRDLDEGLLQAIESETSLTFGSPSEQGAALGLGASPPRRLGVGGDAGLGSRPASPTRVPRPPSSADLEQKLAREAVAALAGGPLPEAGKRVGAGRIDFALQESTLSSQYLSALSAHFLYWSSPDVALLLLRAVRGLDPLTGEVPGEKATPEGGSAAQGSSELLKQ